MAEKWNPEDETASGMADEELRGVASDESDEEFEEDDLDEEEDEESTTF